MRAGKTRANGQPATEQKTKARAKQAKSAARGKVAQAAQPAQTAVALAGAQIHEHTLENGLRVLIVERHADPVVAVMLYYRVGSKDEREHESGVSHFLEHMMFKGTDSFGKGMLDRTTTSLGGQNNAFTGNDHTAYWYEFAADRWERALLLEADRMQNLLLDPVEFQSEREVVLEELSMGEDEPWRVLARRVEARLFDRHPYGRPIIGFRDTLRGMAPNDMREYYRRFYHPGNSVLLVCGDVEPRSALESIRTHFGAIPSGPARETVEAVRPELEEPFGEQRLEMRWPDRAKRLLILWRTVTAGTPEDAALDLAMTILTTGRNSRLQRKLVLDGALATSVSASNDTRVESGAFWLMAEGAEKVDLATLEAAVLAELELLGREGPTAKELTRARQILLSSEAHDAETTTDLAEELGGWAIDVHWNRAFDGGRRHAAVTAKQLREVVTKYLSKDRRVVGWCLPAEPSSV